MSWRRALALVALLAGCGPSRALPELPAVELTGTQAAVREALEGALAAARARPDEATAVVRLGMVLQAHSQMAGAARAYERAALLAPEQAEYAYYWGAALAGLGRYEEALEPLRRSLRGKEAPAVRLRLADALYAAGRTAEARKEYEVLLAADAGMAAAHYGLGRCLQGPEAVAALERAVALFPRYGAARFALAGVYRQMGKRAEAERVLAGYERDKLTAPAMADPAMEAVAALDASSAGMMRGAQALERQGRLAEAAALIEKALGADEKLTQGWVNLISIYARIGRADRAEEAYRKAIALSPNSAEAYYNYGVLCAGMDRVAEARTAFERSVELDPSHAEALDNLGAVIEMTGAWDRAAGLYRRALAVKPGLQLAHFHLGRILANQRRWAEAIAELEKAIEPEDSQTPGYLYALGATHARAGNPEKAVMALERARAAAGKYGQGELAAAIERDLGTLRARARSR